MTDTTTPTAAPTAPAVPASPHQEMLQRWDSGDREGAQALLPAVNAAAERAPARTDDTWRDGELAPLVTMPEAPTIAATEVDRAVETLTNLGGNTQLLSKVGSAKANSPRS
jgi:hypothetical protein